MGEWYLFCHWLLLQNFNFVLESQWLVGMWEKIWLDLIGTLVWRCFWKKRGQNGRSLWSLLKICYCKVPWCTLSPWGECGCVLGCVVLSHVVRNRRHQPSRKKAMWHVFLVHLMCLISSSMTALCSVHPETPGRNAFCTAGSINLFLVRNVVTRFARIRCKVFTMVLDSAIGLKFPGSSVVPFLWMSFNILSPHAAGTALVSRTLLKSVANVWWVQGRWNRIPYGRPSGPGLDVWLADLRTSKISIGLIGPF